MNSDQSFLNQSMPSEIYQPEGTLTTYYNRNYDAVQ